MKLVTKVVIASSITVNLVVLPMLFSKEQPEAENTNKAARIQGLYDREIVSLLKKSQRQYQHPAPKKAMNANHPEMIMNAAYITDTMVYGDEDARFKMVSYADIECPSCRQIHSHLKAVVDHSKRKVSWEYKHFPLANHNPAAISQAAIVTCAFKEKGNQWAWLILGELIKHTKGNGAGQANYSAFAEHVKVLPDWLLSCTQNRQHQIDVEKDYKEGLSLGIQGTPTIIITDNVTGKVKRLDGFHSAEQISQILFTMSR